MSPRFRRPSLKWLALALPLAWLVGCGGGTSGDTGGSASGSTSASGGSNGSGGSSGQACSGIDLEQSGALDLDVAPGGATGLVHISGQVTLNQAALPSASASRGQLVFTGKTGGSYTYPLGASGAVTYQLDVVPDTYAVALAANPALCGDGSAMPCVSGTLREGVVVGTGGGALDLDIPSVQVSGAVTVNGETMPNASGSRGAITFTSSEGSATTSSLATSGAAHYQLALLPGSYDVLFQGNPQLCGGAALPQVPCNAATLRTGVALQASGALDLDVAAIQVTGNVTLNGGALSGSSVGSVVFTGQGGGALTSATLGTGRSAYGFTLVPGTYDVSWVSSGQGCGSATPPAAPCNGGTLRTGVALGSSGALDLDLKSVQVTGTVTVNGQPMPAASGVRGALSFSPSGSAESPTGFTAGSFVSTGAAHYAASLMPGTYDLTYVANPSLCHPGSALPGVPCNGGVVRRAVALQSSGALDVDLQVVQATGNVTLNGAPLTAATGSRGAIAFALADGSAASAELGSSGAGSYGLSLLAGTYEVSYQGNPALCGTSPSSDYPCAGGILRSGLSLNQSGALDLDIPAIQLTGSVTLGGQRMPDASSSRGAIVFTGEPGQQSASIALSATGVASYSVTLIPGRYAVGYANAPALCGTAPFPCMSENLRGCP